MATRRRVARDFQAPPLTRADVEALSARYSEPAWLREARLAAWNIYEALPMPTTNDEAWRRTDYRHINWESAGVLPQANAGRFEDIPAASRQPLLGEQQGGLLAFVDDQPVHYEVNEALTRQGVIFTDLRTAAREHPDLVRRHLMTHAVTPGTGKFAALNAALWTHGVFLYVPRGQAVELPAHSIF